MTDKQYAEILAFAAKEGMLKPVPVKKVLADLDPPRLIADDPAAAPHLRGAVIFVCSQDFNDLNKRVMAESRLTTERN